MEIENNLEEVLRKSKLSKAEFEEVLTMVELQIDFIPADEFMEFLHKAKEISPANDFPYVALSMHFKSMGYEVGIWSNDTGLKKAMEKRGINVFPTHLLLKRLGLVLFLEQYGGVRVQSRCELRLRRFTTCKKDKNVGCK